MLRCLAFLVACLLSACAAAQPPADGGRGLISRAEIETLRQQGAYSCTNRDPASGSCDTVGRLQRLADGKIRSETSILLQASPPVRARLIAEGWQEGDLECYRPQTASVTIESNPPMERTRAAALTKSLRERLAPGAEVSCTGLVREGGRLLSRTFHDGKASAGSSRVEFLRTEPALRPMSGG